MVEKDPRTSAERAMDELIAEIIKHIIKDREDPVDVLEDLLAGGRNRHELHEAFIRVAKDCTEFNPALLAALNRRETLRRD